MALEVRVGKRLAKVQLLNREGDLMKFEVDGRIYDLDMVEVEPGIWSILYRGKSYNLEIIPGGKPKSYTVNTLFQSYEADIVDAEAKYMEARDKSAFGEASNRILSPMPGKIVRIPVAIGQEVKAGETVIIVSAMKMESEFKAAANGVVREIFVKEGDTVDGNQVLIVIK
jgi:biotin carboxyl carrier protein